MEQELLDTMLTIFQEHNLLKQRGKQRTDSSHVVATIRGLNRLESVSETLRATLNNLASAVPEWLSEIAHPNWFDRYGKRIEEYRLPKGKDARRELAEIIGVDGMILLDAIYSEASQDWLREIPAVETLRRAWVHQYYVIEGQLRLRKAEDLPPASLRSDSPYDPEAHYGTKRDIHWTGYKVHITETCDEDLPRLITHIETTIAPQSDVEMTEPIHAALSNKGQLPSEHIVDGGYVDAELLVTSQSDYEIELVVPIKSDASWQAHDKHAYAIDSFDIDWEAKTVTCPQGQTTPAKNAYGDDVIVIRFSRPGCRLCDSRSLCMRSKKESRSLTLRPQSQHEAIQKSPQWKERYNKRAALREQFLKEYVGLGYDRHAILVWQKHIYRTL